MNRDVMVPQFSAMQMLNWEQCTALVQSAPMGIVYLDRVGQRIYGNPSYARILGLSAEEMHTGVGGSQYVHPDDKSRVMKQWYDAFEKQGSFVSEYRVLYREGHIKWVQAQVDPIRNDAGEVTHWTGVLIEITDRKRTEDEVRENEARLKLLIEQVPASVWTTDTQLRFTSSTEYPRVRPLYTKSELLGRQLQDIFVGQPPDDAARSLAAHENALKGERGTSEGIFGGFYFESRVDPLRDANGEIIGTIGVALDVTEHRRAQEKLREANAQLELIFKQVPTVLWTTDRDLRVTSTTGPGDHERGVWFDGSNAQTIYEIAEAGSVGYDTIVGGHERALRGESVTYEALWRERNFRTTVHPLRSADGEIAGTIGLTLDITERIEAEKQIREAHDRLEERVKERTRALSDANAALEREAIERAHLVEALRASEQRYAGMLSAQQTLVGRSNLKYELIYQNDAYARALGVNIGDPVIKSIHPDDQEKTLVALKSLMQPPHVVEFESRRWIDESWHWVHWQYSVLRDRLNNIEELQAVGFDVTERHIAEQSLRESLEANQRLLAELDHRVWNNIQGLTSLVSALKKRSKSVDEFATAIQNRLTAMIHYQKLLASTGGLPVALLELVTSMLGAIRGTECPEVDESVSGPDVNIAPSKTGPLAMILFEWLTNSCKYGAHRTGGARLAIHWEIVTRDEADWLTLRWTERGGPTIPPNLKPSFGTELIRGFATRELAGRVQLNFPPEGAQHVLEFPLT